LNEKRTWVEPENSLITIQRQCELIGLPRASYYYQSQGESPENIRLMHVIDELFTEWPFYGVEKMTAHLCRKGHDVNVKRIRRLMRKMGLEAVYPKPKLTQRHPEHRVYPYLLRELNVERPNHVWCTDITYIRLVSGFVYLVAIMDWFSRYVLSWELSISLETAFCLDALNQAFIKAKPEIFNSDQGSQFTSKAFTDVLNAQAVKISMDGRGRCYDNILIERLFRSVKYEKVYLNDWHEVKDARMGLDDYFSFYNDERPHQSLDYQSPAEVYYGAS
jgi:putative transposase